MHTMIKFIVISCHLLLGGPWEFDRRVLHDGYLNTFTLTFNDRLFTLKPSTPPPLVSTPVLFLQQAPFEDEMH